jgi:DNA-binding winged helix-turn-helix (wHTH) protein
MFLFAGPLNLNLHTKEASTALGDELRLAPKEFDALEILATCENDLLTFEELYQVVWNDNLHGRDVAQQGLNNLSRQVNEIGRGFMWIEYTQSQGYTFRTRWANNWKANISRPPILTAIDGGSQTGRTKRSKKAAKIITGAMVFAVSVAATFVIMVAPMRNAPAVLDTGIYIMLEDAPVPLGALPELAYTDSNAYFSARESKAEGRLYFYFTKEEAQRIITSEL